MPHNNTAFAQVLKLVPRHEFESLARKHRSGRMARSMTRWSQFVAMAMAQLTGRCNLRDIVSNLAVQSCKLYHLGVDLVTPSSLARVNAEKPWELYEELHGRLLERCQAKGSGTWPPVQGQAVLVGFDDGEPVSVGVSVGEVPADEGGGEGARGPGPSGVPADVRSGDGRDCVLETRECNAKRGVTSDEIIEFTSAKGPKQCPHRLRRIGYRDRETQKDYVFLTTNFDLAARTIADIYKSRWQVELFFKWIKQNLKVKSFVGTTCNAVMTQLWIALCMYLILSYIQVTHRLAWSPSEILRLLQLNLFERRSLLELLGKRQREPTGPFIAISNEVRVELVGQQCPERNVSCRRRIRGDPVSAPAPATT